MPKATKVLETCLYADDLEAAKDFYQKVFGLELFSEAEGRHLFFRCGASMVFLFNPEETEKEHSGKDDGIDVPPHGAHGPGHLAFQVETESLPGWREHFTEQGVPIEREIEWPGGGYSLYVRDPANNSLEIATPGLWETR